MQHFLGLANLMLRPQKLLDLKAWALNMKARLCYLWNLKVPSKVIQHTP